MKSLIKGSVKNHQLPCDYNAGFAQPLSSRVYGKAIKRWISVAMIQRQYAALPLFSLFVLTFPYVIY